MVTSGSDRLQLSGIIINDIYFRSVHIHSLVRFWWKANCIKISYELTVPVIRYLRCY